eukprot:TRINITY_DN6647_c0_g2_i1.p1 TRINITY_DN6647_c0_g2~~TRINITY_DN6647_c0_g2_i1.p1  ORF type:complete len:285 (+),score=9.07 TRINITY_DN6647_c0_g2_i1:70-924(+)
MDGSEPASSARLDDTTKGRFQLVLLVVPWGFFFTGLPCGYGWPSYLFRGTCALFSYSCFMAVFLPACSHCALHLAMISKSIASGLVALTWCTSISGWRAFACIDVCFVIFLTGWFAFSRYSRVVHVSLWMLLSFGASTPIVIESTKGSFHAQASRTVHNFIDSLFWSMIPLTLSVCWLHYDLYDKVSKCAHLVRSHLPRVSNRSDAHHQVHPDPTGVLKLEQIELGKGMDESDIIKGVASTKGSGRCGMIAPDVEESAIHPKTDVQPPRPLTSKSFESVVCGSR